MDTTNKTRIAQIVIAIVIIVAVVIAMKVVISSSKASGQYDAFAQCLTEKGAKFYGAFWCPHCQAQKREFSGSTKYLPYVECSTPDGKAQTQVCRDAGIESYPTWIFADGTRVTGEQSLATLAEKTGCVIEAPTESSVQEGATSDAQ